MMSTCQPTLKFPLTLLTVAVGIGIAGCSPNQTSVDVIPAVYVASVKNESSFIERSFHGKIQPRVESSLSFRVGGKIVSRYVDVGQKVQAGDVLARLDEIDYKLGMEAARLQRRAAEVDSIQARSDAERFARLLSTGAVGTADTERQQVRAEVAEATFEQATRQYLVAKNQLNYTQLIAPFNGVVTSLRIEPGQIAGAGEVVLNLAKDGEMEVHMDIPSSMVDDIESWQASAVLGSSFGDRKSLILREVAPMAHGATGTFRVKYAFNQPIKDLESMMGVSAQVTLRRANDISGVLLPIGAILETKSNQEISQTGQSVTGPAVWVVDRQTNQISRRYVQLVTQTTSHVLVSGLKDEEWVVTVGAQKLDPSLNIRPVKAAVETVSLVKINEDKQ